MNTLRDTYDRKAKYSRRNDAGWAFGLGIACLVGMLLRSNPVIFTFGLPALCFGIVSVAKKGVNWMAVVGIVVGALAMLWLLVLLVVVLLWWK